MRGKFSSEARKASVNSESNSVMVIDLIFVVVVDENIYNQKLRTIVFKSLNLRFENEGNHMYIFERGGFH